VIHAVLFYSPTCGHCKIVIEDVLPALDAEYGSQLQIYGINTHTEIGNQLFGNFVNQYNIAPDDQVVPALLVGDQVLFGSNDIPKMLPEIIEEGLKSGGIPWPQLAGLPEAMAGSLEVDAPVSTPDTQSISLWDKFSTDLAANILAVVVLAGMIGVLVYTGISFIGNRGNKSFSPSWIIPLLSILGIGVAAYLSYVEYNQVEAVCGPVGNCNAVQQSSYATLFGFLPVGTLGLLGYLGIILLWLLEQLDLAGLSKTYKLLIWIFSLGGTLFSIYLTFLEPFVIGATCLWCLSSAVIITGIFLTASNNIQAQQDQAFAE
jgi:uncharacterized membrane protein